MVYSTRRHQLFTLTESLNWQNLAGPISPEVEVEPADDPQMVRTLEEVATKRHFLQPGTPIDFDDPECAVERWHKENGTRTTGEIRVHFYGGQPRYGSNVALTLDTGPIVWMSFFKGPLFGYDRQRNQHFIAYSPAWFYNWAKCLAFDGEHLWFGVHCRSGLMSFRPRTNFLGLHESFEAARIPEVEGLEIEDGNLVLNNIIRIPILALKSRDSSRP